MSEDRLAQAARHVWENERRIAKQAVLIERLETDGHVVPASSERRFSLNQGDVSHAFYLHRLRLRRAISSGSLLKLSVRRVQSRLALCPGARRNH